MPPLSRYLPMNKSGHLAFLQPARRAAASFVRRAGIHQAGTRWRWRSGRIPRPGHENRGWQTPTTHRLKRIDKPHAPFRRRTQPSRKKTADIVTLIEFLLEYDTAGDPITGLKWSRRTTEKIAMALGDFGVSVSPNTVARLLHQMGYSL